MVKFYVPRLGELLARAGLVPAARIDEALERQLGTNRRIGELLVEMNLLHRVELAAVISIQEDLRDGRVEAAQRVSVRLGSMLLNAAAVSDAQLERALAVQAQDGGLLGDILVRQGSITPAQRNGALKLQAGLAGRVQGRFLIGRMLADADVITEGALEKAILRQQASGKRLGELLVDAGQLSEGTLVEFLERQKRLRAALLAGASLATDAGPEGAGGR
ncbi:MAG TPA: hypothetical protein VEG36_02895 [Burkholderiales bacterium]|nr:hypothetical protein [Burkholderiales bacterium]